MSIVETMARTISHDEALQIAKRFIAALSAAGFVIVPREPTEAMKQAAWDHDRGKLTSQATYAELWSAMLSAAEGKK